MKILILNWRDPKNPDAGGAEQVTQKYAKYWVEKGHSVFWLSNRFEDSEAHEASEGILYQRLGPALSKSALKNIFVYPLYLLQTVLCTRVLIRQRKIDVIIDEIHGLPFFTPLYSSARNILLVCEVAGPIWDKMWPFPVNKIGKFLEKIIYWVYRRTEIWAISQNTKKDILELFSTLKVKILPLGIEILDPKGLGRAVEKDKQPSAVFLGRLVKMKGVESAITAASLIIQTLPNFKLYIIGKGEPAYEAYLKDLITQKNLEKNVEFLGFTSEEKKYEILARCHFLLHPSYKEGFGLTVLEAGAVGTPSIIRAGSSLDELINNGVDGFIVQDELEMAEKFIKSIRNKTWLQLGRDAKIKVLKYGWEEILSMSGVITGF